MEQDYIDALEEQNQMECNVFGQKVIINGITVNAIVSTSATLKNLQVAGFYKNQVLDIILPIYEETPKLNHIVVYDGSTYQVKQIEKMEYNTGNRLTVELVT